jgi:hypothetical protein
MAAAASSLKQQAQDMVSAVAVFKLAHGESTYTSAKLSAATPVQARARTPFAPPPKVALKQSVSVAKSAAPRLPAASPKPPANRSANGEEADWASF